MDWIVSCENGILNLGTHFGGPNSTHGPQGLNS